MKKLTFIFCALLALQLANGQDKQQETVVDSLYVEDQFYISTTFNFFGRKFDGLSQNGFSFGLHFGFIKDFPLNKRRNIAIGLGLGYSTNSFNNNLFINRDTNNTTTYNTIDSDISFSKNKLSHHLIELPLEFRWRTSTAKTYSFWRIYTGLKLGYVVGNNSKFLGDPEDLKIKDINEINKFQYGLTMSAGYNTWNFYAYYALNPIFSSQARLNSGSIDINAIKIGLIFYIL